MVTNKQLTQVVFASQNKHKQAEAQALFADLPLELVFPEHIPDLKNFDPEETGATFIENALIKARSYAAVAGLACIADDSGIEIDALGGLPGVHSNRWFPGTDADRNQEVLRRLANNAQRGAAYVTAVCYYDPQTEEYVIFEEKKEGSIAAAASLAQGFAYDKIFIPEGEQKPYAELGFHVKNEDSQRARAYKKLKTHLKEVVAI